MLKVTGFWLKKIWQISGASSTRPIKVQEKQKKIVNLRPILWYSQAKKVTPPFNSREVFLAAIKETLEQTNDADYAEQWLLEVNQSYVAHLQTNVGLVE